MSSVNRRAFIQRTAQMAAAAWATTGFGRAETAVAPAALPAHPKAARTCKLGKSGLTCTLLGMGTGTKAWEGSSAQNRQGREGFVKTLVHAYERGLRYYDMADMYGAHDYVKAAMKQAKMPREKLMLLSKTVAKDAATAKADLERFRTELDTDYLDIVLLHCMQKGDWPETMKPCRDVLSEAKAKGTVRAVGVSCHSLDALEAAASSDWVDVMLSRINPFGVKMDGAPKRVASVLTRAHAAGKGVIGMKIAGEGQKVEQLTESIEYVLGLGCVNAFTIGFITPNEIDDTMARIESVA